MVGAVRGLHRLHIAEALGEEPIHVGHARRALARKADGTSDDQGDDGRDQKPSEPNSKNRGHVIFLRALAP